MQRTKASPGGGWSFTAYSNPEAFSETVVQSFAAYASSIGMDNKGTYPGNAKNYMIEQYNQDKDYIERSHLALIDSHGNVFGPDLEYVPRSRSGFSWYQWGDEGLLQWIMIQGCDCLGFPIFPDGRPAPFYPSPDRWDGAFLGISGLLGYRSASYYQKSLLSPQLIADAGLPIHTMSLPADTAAVLVNAVASGQTFFDAWTAAADFLHRSLDVQAEVAVFASAEACLRDSVGSFYPERKLGLEASSIRYRRVGSGKAPIYHYCDRVDLAGNPLCTAMTKKEVKEAAGIRIFQRESFTDEHPDAADLPIAQYNLDERVLGWLREMSRELNCLEFDPSSILSDKSVVHAGEALSSQVGLCGRTVLIRKAEMDAEAILQSLHDGMKVDFKGGRLLVERVEPTALATACHSLALEISGQKYTVLPRPSSAIHRARTGQDIQFELPDVITVSGKSRKVPDTAAALEMIAHKLPTWVEGAELLRSEIVFNRLGSRCNGVFLPARRFDIILEGAGRAVVTCIIV